MVYPTTIQIESNYNDTNKKQLQYTPLVITSFLSDNQK